MQEKKRVCNIEYIFDEITDTYTIIQKRSFPISGNYIHIRAKVISNQTLYKV